MLVLAPAAVLCVPAAIVGTRDRLTIWLGCGALGGLAFAIIWYPVFGYLGDWDIYAGVPYALTVWAAVVAMRRLPPRSFRRLAYVWITLNALHTIAWWQAFRSQPFM